MSATTNDPRLHERRSFRADERDASTPSLLRRLAGDVSALFAHELALLKAETNKSINDFKAATARIAMGGSIAFMGGFFLLLSAVYGLSNVVDPWLAALLVGGVVTVIGLVMLATGRRKLEPAAMAPRRTAASIRKDAQMIREVADHEHK